MKLLLRMVVNGCKWVQRERAFPLSFISDYLNGRQAQAWFSLNSSSTSLAHLGFDIKLVKSKQESKLKCEFKLGSNLFNINYIRMIK